MTEERKAKMERVLRQRQTGLTVVLENVFDVHNVSAIMRTADAVGVSEIYLIYSRTPPPGRWGYRSSGSAYKWIKAHHFESVDDCIIAVRQKYDRLLATHLSNEATSLYDIDFTQSTALVFGNEQKGLSQEIIAQVDGNLIIPQVGMIHSLNISVACAVSLYEAFRQKQHAGHYLNQQLSLQDYNITLADWMAPKQKTK